MAEPEILRELARHFFGRFFDKESLSPQGEPEAGVIQTLGILAAPSGFVVILLLPLTFSSWDLVAFRFLFLCYSMTAMGVVMVFEWGALFLDKRDYLILTPLPLRVFPMVLAKMAALGVFLAMFLAAANFFGVLFWPSLENRGNFVTVAGTHLAVMAAGGLFSALAIAALQGVLVTVFRGSAYRRISVCTQTAVMALLIMFFFLSPLMAFSLEKLCRADSQYLRWFPGFWFAGLYEQLRPAVRHPGDSAAAASVLRSLGTLAVRALGISLAVFALTFLPGYRRHARRVLEAPEPSPRGPGWLFRTMAAAVSRLLRDPVECGVFHFIGQTIARSTKHRLFLATYGGLGAALVTMVLAGGGTSQRVALTLSFILVSGLRAAFNFPSDLRANWVFQVGETSSLAGYVRATRAWVMLYAILPLFLVLAVLEATFLPWPMVIYHFAFGVAASMVLMEAMFLGFRKVPFTCSHFPGKVNLVFLGVLYVFGFTLYSKYMASLEERLWARPLGALAFFLAVVAALLALGRLRNRLMGTAPRLEYEDDRDPVVCELRLTEQ